MIGALRPRRLRDLAAERAGGYVVEAVEEGRVPPGRGRRQTRRQASEPRRSHHGESRDAPFWALRIDQAKTFTVQCLNTKGGSVEMWPQDNVILYEIPARAGMPPVKVYCYDHARLKPDVMKDAERKHNRKFGEFTLFVGEKGLIGSDAHIIPQEKHKAFAAPPKSIPRAHGGPIEDLFHAIKHGATPCSNFVDAAGPMTAFVLTGHLAQFAGVGQKLEWDVEKMKCTNMPKINELLRRTYRKGWEV